MLEHATRWLLEQTIDCVASILLLGGGGLMAIRMYKRPFFYKHIARLFSCYYHFRKSTGIVVILFISEPWVNGYRLEQPGRHFAVRRYYPVLKTIAATVQQSPSRP